ncbi:LacI family transcriptional regulator [Devosia sp. UYZn731]|uniref:LacI family transcriptional regulator n=1 Tax=Devosia sp. UYZn731 TaxID=3156345 RepID=UPI00339268F1
MEAKRPQSSASQTVLSPKHGRPTLRTIAGLTGLAVTTVSRALSNHAQIALDTRENVQRVAREVGYLPDRAAQRLKTGRTHVISLLLDPHEEILGFGTSLLHGLTLALRGTPYHLIATPNFQDEPAIDPVNFIIRNKLADGIIFSRTEPFDPRVRLLMENGFPFVSHGRTDFSTQHAYVDFDNSAFAYEATRRLISKGRSRVTIILPPKRLTFAQHMLHGFMTAVREAGVEYEIPEAVTLDSSAGMIRDYVNARAAEPNPPDGFVCGGEVSALATIAGHNDRGMVLGREFDIVAKQTSRLLSHIQPRVETIYEDLAAAGEQMGQLLIRQLSGETGTDLQILQAPRFGVPTSK